MRDPIKIRVGSVVIDCNDFERMFAFWRDALGYVPRDEPDEDWVVRGGTHDRVEGFGFEG